MRREVLQRAEQSRLPLLNRNEALVIAHRLEELGGVYVDKQLGLLARLMANRVYDRVVSA